MVYKWLFKFLEAMKKGLKKNGDYLPSDHISDKQLREELYKNIIIGNWADVANFSLFLWARQVRKGKARQLHELNK